MLKSSSPHCFQHPRTVVPDWISWQSVATEVHGAQQESFYIIHNLPLAKPSSLFSCCPLCCPQAPCCEPLPSAVGFLTLVVVSDGQKRENSWLPPFPAYLLTFADDGIGLLQSLLTMTVPRTNRLLIIPYYSLWFPMQFEDSYCWVLSAALFELKTVGADPVHQSIAPIASSVMKSWPCKSTIWGASGPSKAKSSVERPNFSSTSSRSFAQRFWSLGASVLQISRRERAQLPMKLSFVKSSPNKSDGAWLSCVKNVRRSSAKSSSCGKAGLRTCLPNPQYNEHQRVNEGGRKLVHTQWIPGPGNRPWHPSNILNS